MEDRENKEDKDKAFPSDYKHVGKMVRETEERIQQIDKHMENVPKDSAPALRPKQPGFLQPRQPGSRDEMISRLEKEKGQVKEDAFAKVEKETINADPKTAVSVRDAARNRIFGNKFREMDAAQKQDVKPQTRDIETSQDYADSQRSGQVAPKQKDKGEEGRAQPNVQSAKEGKGISSMSARFSQSLNYTKASEKAEKTPDKLPQPKKDKGDKDMG